MKKRIGIALICVAAAAAITVALVLLLKDNRNDPPKRTPVPAQSTTEPGEPTTAPVEPTAEHFEPTDEPFEPTAEPEESACVHEFTVTETYIVTDGDKTEGYGGKFTCKKCGYFYDQALTDEQVKELGLPPIEKVHVHVWCASEIEVSAEEYAAFLRENGLNDEGTAAEGYVSKYYRMENTCENCGASEINMERRYEPISGNGEDGKECSHVYEKKVIDPGCGAKGYTEHVCSKCGNTFISDFADALGHVFGEWSTVKAASCEVEGSEERVCSRCGEKEMRAVAGLSHNYGEWTVAKAATCSSSGEEVQKCTRCGKSKSRTVPATEHKWTKGEVVHNDSNCADEQVVECSMCGKKCVQIVGWSHTFENASNKFAQLERCIHCNLYVTNYYDQFENLFSSQDENAALYTDKVHFNSKPQTVRADWSPLWKGFERAVTESAGRYCSSGHREDYSMSGIDMTPEVQNMSDEELYAEYNKFRKAFKEIYGWTPADIEFSYTGEILVESSTRDMFNAFKNGTSGLSESRKKQITETLINELLYDSGVSEGMQVYNAVGLLYDTISEHVQYDWTISYHSAFYGLCCGACVCDGFSEIFRRCCDLAGINCKTIIGTNRGEGHAWNMVTFSDGTERFVDVTINSSDYRILFPKDYLNEYKW